MKTIHHTLLDNGATLADNLVITQTWHPIAPTLEFNGIEVPSILSDYYQAGAAEVGYDGVVLYELNKPYCPVVDSLEEMVSLANLFDCFHQDDPDVDSPACFIIPADHNAPIQLITLGQLLHLTPQGFTDQPTWVIGYRNGTGAYYPCLYELPLTPATATLQDIWNCILDPQLAYSPHTDLPPKSTDDPIFLLPEYDDAYWELRGEGYSKAEASRIMLSKLYNVELPPISFPERSIF